MAVLPPYNSYSVEDFQGQKDWIDKLISPLNNNFSKTISALNHNLTISDNLLAQVSGVKVSTNSAWTAGASAAGQNLSPYATLITPGKIKLTMSVKPIGLVIWKCAEIATNPTTLHYGVTADWSYSNGTVFINAVSGIEPAKSYNLTVAIFGG